MVKVLNDLNVLAVEDVEKIHDTTLNLLRDVGIRVTSAKGRSLLLDNGCRSLSDEYISIPSDMVEKAISQNEPFTVYAQREGGDLEFLKGKAYVHNFGSAATIIDFKSGSKRVSTLQDLIQSFRVLEKMDACHMVYPLVTPTDVPESLSQIVSAAVAFQNTTKPVDVSVVTGQEARAVVQLMTAAHGGAESLKKRCRSILMFSPISPLTFNDDCIDVMFTAANTGIPVHSLPCPILGVTAPMSMAGGLVLQNMESLAFLVLMRLLDPDAKVVYGARLGFANMYSATHMDGRPEKGLLGAAAAQLCKKYNMVSDVYGMATGSHSAADIQMGYDKAINAMSAILAGADLTSGLGCMSHAVATSLEQLVLDNEIFSMILKIARGINVNEDSLAAEVISDVAVEGGSFLEQAQHTLEYLRSGEVYESPLDKQLSYEKWMSSGCPGVYNSARDAVAKILDTPDEIPENEAVTEELQRIARDLGIEFDAALKLGAC